MLADFSGFYKDGQISYKRDELNNLGLPASSIEFLVEFGLPKLSEDDESSLGVVFEERFYIGRNQKIVIGKEIWADNLLIEIDPSSGWVLAATDSGSESVFMNSDVNRFILFLSKMHSFMESEDADNPPARIYSAEEMQKILSIPLEERVKEAQAKLKLQKEMKKKMPKKPTRKQKRRDIRQSFKETDPSSLRADTWWDRILEQAEDGLI
jgi:hypothetical protein